MTQTLRRIAVRRSDAFAVELIGDVRDAVAFDAQIEDTADQCHVIGFPKHLPSSILRTLQPVAKRDAADPAAIQFQLPQSARRVACQVVEVFGFAVLYN
jgi:hypothetical protein